jgi:hypothetical protein
MKLCIPLNEKTLNHNYKINIFYSNIYSDLPIILRGTNHNVQIGLKSHPKEKHFPRNWLDIIFPLTKDPACMLYWN